MQGSILILAGITILMALLAYAMYVWLPDTGLANNVARAIQASVTAVAIAAGGVFASVKLQLFRDFAPHVTITQTATHRVIGDSYVHLLVTTTLHNGSKVKVDFREGYFRLQLISPITDMEVENLYRELVEETSNQGIFQWPTLTEVLRHWEKGDLIIEPGESHHETCEFIVTKEVKSILIDTFFYNSNRPNAPTGWGITSAYDIMLDS